MLIHRKLYISVVVDNKVGQSPDSALSTDLSDEIKEMPSTSSTVVEHCTSSNEHIPAIKVPWHEKPIFLLIPLTAIALVIALIAWTSTMADWESKLLLATMSI